MGLKHPRDLKAWRRWQLGQQTYPRRLRHLMRSGFPNQPESCFVTWVGSSPRIVFVLDSMSPTSVSSLLDPIQYLDPNDVVVVSPLDPRESLPDYGWKTLQTTLPQLGGLLASSAEIFVASGHYLPLGAWAYAHSRSRHPKAEFVTVQHGILTPFTPPLAPHTNLLAWSEQDAQYWTKQRPDVASEVVGAQLLWKAARFEGQQGAIERQPVYLGQLHGAELDFRDSAKSAENFCLSNDAIYRPHPAETDRRSLRTHQRWESRGLRIDRSHRPLTALNSPLVSAFSTGILEAASRGIPAWVYFQQPPSWLQEVWSRYQMSTWGASPTPSPVLGTSAPASTVAGSLAARLT